VVPPEIIPITFCWYCPPLKVAVTAELEKRVVVTMAETVQAVDEVPYMAYP